ncbi:MAG: hypothetical protein ABJH70_07795, partial [Nitratireductor sp.]
RGLDQRPMREISGNADGQGEGRPERTPHAAGRAQLGSARRLLRRMGAATPPTWRDAACPPARSELAGA